MTTGYPRDYASVMKVYGAHSGTMGYADIAKFETPPSMPDS